MRVLEAALRKQGEERLEMELRASTEMIAKLTSQLEAAFDGLEREKAIRYVRLFLVSLRQRRATRSGRSSVRGFDQAWPLCLPAEASRWAACAPVKAWGLTTTHPPGKG